MATRHLSDWIEAYMEYTENSEPPLLYKKWVAISTIAAALQRKCMLQWGSLTFYPNMYIVLVGPAGRCRKGTAMGPGYNLLRSIGVKMAAEAITREALIRELERTSSISGDQRSATVFNHCSLTVFSKELTVFLGQNNLNLMADLTDWFDCADTWTYRTKNSGENEIVGVWVNLIGATTPELIQTTMPRDTIGLGLTSRIIFVYEDRKHKTVPAPFLTPHEEQLYEKLKLDLESINMLAGKFRVTEDFVDIYTKWYVANDGNPPFTSQFFNGYFERRATHLMKLSCILSASRTDDMIVTGTDMQRAINLLTETERKMPATFRGMGRSSLAEVTSRLISMLAVKKKVELSEVMRTFYHDIDHTQLESVIKALETMHFCRQVFEADKTYLEYTGESLQY